MRTSVMQQPIHLSVEGHEFPRAVVFMVIASVRASAIHGPPLSVESREFSRLAGGSTGTSGAKTYRLMIGGCSAIAANTCGGNGGFGFGFSA